MAGCRHITRRNLTFARFERPTHNGRPRPTPRHNLPAAAANPALLQLRTEFFAKAEASGLLRRRLWSRLRRTGLRIQVRTGRVVIQARTRRISEWAGLSGLTCRCSEGSCFPGLSDRRSNLLASRATDSNHVNRRIPDKLKLFVIFGFFVNGD